MAVIETNLVRRADLEAIPASFPNFLIDKLAPYFRRDAQAGRLYYAALRQAPAAQYGRDTAAIAEITANVVAATSTTFACEECRSREEMSYDQRSGAPDNKDAFDNHLATLCKRSFYVKLETMCAKALLESDAAVDAIADPVGVIDAQCAKLRDKAYGVGEVALTMSHSVFAALKKNQDIIERMKATGVVVDRLSPRYISEEQMAAVFGVDRVYVGMDSIWRFNVGGAYRGNVALSILPVQSVDPIIEPQWARTIFFDWGSDAEHFILEEFYNPVKACWTMDSVGLVDFKILNASMAVPIQVFAGGDSSSSN